MAKKKQATQHLKAHAAPAVTLEVVKYPTEVTDKLHFGRIYWVVGMTPKGMTRNDVKDPPTNGNQCCFAFPGEKRWTVFCPISFRGFQLTIGSYEQKSFEPGHTAFTKDSLAKLVTNKWEQYAKANAQVDYNMAARVLKELGAPIPTAMPTASEEDGNKERGGKPVADKLLKPVKRKGKRGDVLAWFLETGEARSIREAMAQFEASRSSVLSYLHNLNKDHGVGYTLIGDTALVTLPDEVTDKELWT